jgi:hypothetical protein
MSVKTMTCSAALCTLSLFVVDNAVPQQAWHTMTGLDGSFTVEFPQPPKHQAAPNATAAGMNFTTHIYWVELDRDRTYMAAMSVYPEDPGVGNYRRVLQGGLDGVANRPQGTKWASIDWKQYWDLPAVDAIGRTGSGREIRTYSVMKGSRVFVLSYVGATGSSRSSDVNRFIASLRLR